MSTRENGGDPQSFRPRPSAEAAIAAEVLASQGTISRTEAIHRIIDRGKLNHDDKSHGVQVYLVGALACTKELEYVSLRLKRLTTQLDRVRSRLAGPLNPETLENPKRRAEVEVWRKLAQELPAQIEELVQLADQLVRWMGGGLTHRNYDALTHIHRGFKAQVATEEASWGKSGVPTQERTAELLRMKDATLLFEVVLGLQQLEPLKPAELSAVVQAEYYQALAEADERASSGDGRRSP